MSANPARRFACSPTFSPVFNAPFSREQKLEIVQRILFGGECISAVARALDVDVKVIARWQREYKRDPEKAFPRPSRLAR